MIELRVSRSCGVAGWRDAAAVHADRLAGDPADRVEVVDRVVEQLEPRRPLEKRPQVPGLVDDDADVDVDERRRARRRDHEVVQRQHAGTEAQLEVHAAVSCRSAQHARIRVAVGEVLAHRLLDQHRGALRELLEDADDLIAGHGEIEDDAGVATASSSVGKIVSIAERAAAVARARAASMSKMPATG